MRKFSANIICVFVPSRKMRHKIRRAIMGQPQTPRPVEPRMGFKSYSAAAFISPRVTIGKYCSIAIGAVIGPDNHVIDGLSTSPYVCATPDDLRFEDITIENDVWIGAYAVITNKCKTIGTGAIIAAGAVVTKPVPPYAIVAGVPAKIIRYRFSSDKIHQLLASRWWDIPYEELKNMHCENIDMFLDDLKTAR